MKKLTLQRRSPCPLCNSLESRIVYTKADGIYVVCQQCQLFSVDPLPSLETMSERAEYWSGTYHSSSIKVEQQFDPNFQKVAFGDTLSMIGRYARGGKLLDVGCSIGGFVSAAQATGWEATGIDISSAVEVGKSKGLDLQQMDLKKANFPKSNFDVVTLLDVIEHIPDPCLLLEEIYQILKPSGCVFILTPNLSGLSSRLLRENWESVGPQDHLALYTRKTLGKMLHGVGFRKTFFSSFDLSIAQWLLVLQELFSRNRTQKSIQTDWSQNSFLRRKIIGDITASKVLQQARMVINSGLKVTGLGDKLIALAVK